MDNGTPGRLDPVDGAIPGDATYDGVVNLADLAKLATNFGQATANGDDVRWQSGDFTNDGVVNLADLAKLATNFGAVGSDGFPQQGGAAAASNNLIQQASNEAILLNTRQSSIDANDSNWDHIGNLLDESESQNIV